MATTEQIVDVSPTRWRSFYELTKPRVVMLIVFTSVVGTLLAVPGLPPLDALIFGNLGVGLAAASAAVINHVLDERIDAQMSRTKRRPLPTGKLSARAALLFSGVLCVLSMTLLVTLVNTLTALLTFASLIGYAVIYTVWLKRATSQNIVIGGAAGAAPPVLGWAAVTNSIDRQRAAAVPHRVRLDAATLLGAGDRTQGRVREGGHSHVARHSRRGVHPLAGAAVYAAARGRDAHAVRHRDERPAVPDRGAGAQQHVRLARVPDENQRTRTSADESFPFLHQLPHVAVRGAADRPLSTAHVVSCPSHDGLTSLPARFNGQFGVTLFHQHHGVLLLRSADRDDGGPRRIELLFRGVVWMSLPSWFSDFTVEQALLDEVISFIPPSHRGKAESRKVFRVDIDRTPHYVIAGSVFTSRDEGSTSTRRHCSRNWK